jgi:DNA-binding MarR family transcriptional regulator/predicted N-acetyltransferase YhbS
MENAARVRGFNRYYQGKLADLGAGLASGSYSHTDIRVLQELSQRTMLARKEDRRALSLERKGSEERRRSDRRQTQGRKGVTATELADLLGLDPGYLSRILKRFESQLLLVRSPCADDRRQTQLLLTSLGRERCRSLDKASLDRVSQMLQPLSTKEQGELVAAMQSIERLLERRADPAMLLRPHRSGDMGWLLEFHATAYAREYRWGASFEAWVARSVAHFLAHYQPTREACWIAEKDGHRVGSVMVIERAPAVAELQQLLVEAAARRQGLGGRLVEQCRAFARQAGYEKIFAWSQQPLHAARKIFQGAGYRLVEEASHDLFGVPCKGESWVLDL